jgi:hypothetical protein
MNWGGRGGRPNLCDLRHSAAPGGWCSFMFRGSLQWLIDAAIRIAAWSSGLSIQATCMRWNGARGTRNSSSYVPTAPGATISILTRRAAFPSGRAGLRIAACRLIPRKACGSSRARQVPCRGSRRCLPASAGRRMGRTSIQFSQSLAAPTKFIAEQIRESSGQEVRCIEQGGAK